MENHNFRIYLLWVNQLFLWPFSIANCSSLEDNEGEDAGTGDIAVGLAMTLGGGHPGPIEPKHRGTEHRKHPEFWVKQIRDHSSQQK